jgi:hypothetical protein
LELIVQHFDFSGWLLWLFGGAKNILPNGLGGVKWLQWIML